MAKSNKYILELEDKFTRKHNEIDRIALVIAADDAGVEDVDGLLDRFLKTRQQIASEAFVGTSGVQMGWLASQADMLADDWMFAE